MSDYCSICHLVVAPHAVDINGRPNRIVINNMVIHGDCLLKHNQLSIRDLEAMDARHTRRPVNR